MGTSQSSKGPESGVPLIPPWVPDIELTTPAPEQANDPQHEDPAVDVTAALAPQARFQSARRAIGEFASGGSARDMRRGLGGYARTGYGGAATLARRMTATPRTASSLFNALGTLAAGAQLGPNAPTVDVLERASASEVIDAIVEAVKPVDGVQDTEASRRAIAEALSHLLVQFPNADLLHLDIEQRFFAVESFVASDVFMRVCLDIGQVIQQRAPSAAAGLARLSEVREFVREAAASSFRGLREAGNGLTAGNVEAVCRAALNDTLAVFASYAE